MKLEVACDYSRKFKKGDIVEVDAMQFNLVSMTGISFRVVGVWKEPRWLDAGWFFDFRKRKVVLISEEDE